LIKNKLLVERYESLSGLNVNRTHNGREEMENDIKFVNCHGAY